jgi:hypothetical protein
MSGPIVRAVCPDERTELTLDCAAILVIEMCVNSINDRVATKVSMDDVVAFLIGKSAEPLAEKSAQADLHQNTFNKVYGQH